MVTNPLDYVDAFGKAGASGFTFHVEVSKGGVFMLFGLHRLFLGIYVLDLLKIGKNCSFAQIIGKNLLNKSSPRACGQVWH